MQLQLLFVRVANVFSVISVIYLHAYIRSSDHLALLADQQEVLRLVHKGGKMANILMMLVYWYYMQTILSPST